MFEPDEMPVMIRPHPLNPAQTPVLRGQLYGDVVARPYWGVALAHLAHARGTCQRCEPVWTYAAEQWAEVPAGGALFGAIDPGALLVHADDVPPDWADRA